LEDFSEDVDHQPHPGKEMEEVMDLTGKVIVITGASRGLGAGMAKWFGEQGASLGLCARTRPPTEVEDSVSASVDVTDRASLAVFAQEVTDLLGPIDLWVNNAAVLEPIVPQREMTSGQLLEHLVVNVGGVLHGTQVFLDQLESTDHRGALVNISSGLAQRGRAGLAAYSVAKAGVDRLTEVIAVEEPDLLTMALAVSPGVIETDMQVALRDQSSEVLHDVEMFREFAEDGSMNRPARVAEVIAGWVFGGSKPESVVVRVPQENS
jgi:NAD(P)-dependent dehydrogenase (short-subunit alcohol dehydrogenase family)